MLCEDELTRRDAAGSSPVRAAHFESTTTIEEFDFAYNPKVPAAQVRDLASFIEASESVILHGLSVWARP